AIGLILVTVQNFKLIKDNQQMSALNFFANTVDTIANKELALKMADYVYGLHHRSEYQDPLKANYGALFTLQVIQSRLSIMEKTVNRSFFDYGEVTISSGGDFIIVKDTSANENAGNYIVYDRDGTQIAIF